MAESVDHGRAAFDAGRWTDAFAGLSSATAPDDVERLAIVAYLLGRDDVADDAWDRAHRGVTSPPVSTSRRRGVSHGWRFCCCCGAMPCGRAAGSHGASG